MVTGISYETVQSEQFPPQTDEDTEEFRPEDKIAGPLRVAREGKVPLHPAAVRFPASVAGRFASELTGCPGLAFTDQELADLGEIWVQCGVEANPVIQALLATVAMIAIKGLGYKAWERAGREGDLKGKETQPGGGS